MLSISILLERTQAEPKETAVVTVRGKYGLGLTCNGAAGEKSAGVSGSCVCLSKPLQKRRGAILAIARHPREERGTSSPGSPGPPCRPRGKDARFWPKRKPGRGVSTLLDALLAVGFGTELTACALRSISTVGCSAITAGELSCSACPPLPLSRWAR